MKTKHYLQAFEYAFLSALLAVILILTSFFIVEPRVGQAVDSNQFTVKQTIGDEISFLVQPTNVTMDTTINGISGGTANGTTTAVVQSNSPTGYTMTIRFFDNGTNNAMLGDTTASESIRDYSVSGGEPDFNFSTASTSSVFGYTVSAANSADLDASFKDNGSACNTGSSYTYARCWMEPATTTFQIINRTSDTSSGATTTINFRVHVPASPSPSLPADVYTATATLTAVNQ